MIIGSHPMTITLICLHFGVGGLKDYHLTVIFPTYSYPSGSN